MPDKQQILTSIREIAKRLGRAPTRVEFVSRSGISVHFVLQWFPSWNDAVRAAGLRPYALNVRVADRALLEDWGKAARKNRAVPPRRFYLLHGKYNAGTLAKRFGGWSSVPETFRDFAEGKREWADVLALLPARVPLSRTSRPVYERAFSTTPFGAVPCKTSCAQLKDRPIYGNPTPFPSLQHEPLNEQGVVLLFGMLARELGFIVECVQKSFPDCEAKRQIAPGRWQRVSIEFEFESRNFREHGHPASGCNVIVCWRHNWNECPRHIEVIELARAIESMHKAEN